MTQENQIPRKNVLTPADIDLLREMLADHPCKYPFTSEQAQTLVEVADNMQTAKKITFKLVITACILTMLGWMAKGAVQWMIAIVKTGAVPK